MKYRSPNYSPVFSTRKRPAIVPGKRQKVRVYVRGSEDAICLIVEVPEMKEDARCHCVILMHGMMVTKDIYPIPAIARRLASHGIASIRFDFNGHGESHGSFSRMNIPTEIGDAIRVYEYARTLKFIDKIGIVGHGVGGVVAGMIAGHLNRRLSSLVLLAPAFNIRENALKGRIFRTRFNPANPPEHVSVFFHNVGRSCIETAQDLFLFEAIGNYKGPTLIVGGKWDKLVPPVTSLKYREILPQAEIVHMKAQGHLFFLRPFKMLKIVVDNLEKDLLYGPAPAVPHRKRHPRPEGRTLESIHAEYDMQLRQAKEAAEKRLTAEAEKTAGESAARDEAMSAETQKTDANGNATADATKTESGASAGTGTTAAGVEPSNQD